MRSARALLYPVLGVALLGASPLFAYDQVSPYQLATELGGQREAFPIANSVWHNCLPCHNSVSRYSGSVDFSSTVSILLGGARPARRFLQWYRPDNAADYALIRSRLNASADRCLHTGGKMPMVPGCLPQGGAAVRTGLDEYFRNANAGASTPSPVTPPSTVTTFPTAAEMTLVTNDWNGTATKRDQRVVYVFLPPAVDFDLGRSVYRAAPLCTAAVSKAFNGVSWKRTIKRPIQLAPRILKVNFADAGIAAGSDLYPVWDELDSAYGSLEVNRRRNRVFFGIDLTTANITGKFFPNRPIFLSAYDFLLAVTSRRGYLYFVGTQFENTFRLQDNLGIDTLRNFSRRVLARDLLDGSRVAVGANVPGGTRLVEWHPIPAGHRVRGGVLAKAADTYGEAGDYWQTYDFVSSSGISQYRGSTSFLKDPLGPSEFPGESFGRPSPFQRAFQRAYNEVIFTLPNGLHAYHLYAENQHPALDAPQSVALDALDSGRYSPTPFRGKDLEVGISCLGCHRNGMMRYPSKTVNWDELNITNRLTANELKATKELYRRTEVKQKLAAGETKYLQALQRAVGTYFAVTTPAAMVTVPEPVTACLQVILSGRGNSYRDLLNSER